MNLATVTGLPKLSAVAMCCVSVTLPAMAAPPPTRLPENVRAGAEFNHASEKNVLASATQAFTAASQATARPRLDLRPPSTGEFATGMNASGFTIRGGTQLGMLRHTSDRDLAEDREVDNKSFSALREEGAQPHPQGLAQGMAERFHREGLPVARLWENHAALVTLGLNQKGKPGLWLVQKIH